LTRLLEEVRAWTRSSEMPGRPGGDRSLALAVIAAAVVLTALKAVFAARTPLFPDEAFYWQCSQRLGLAYSDHPSLTALMIRAGTALLGPTPLGVRLPFLLAGAAILPVLYGTARPLVGRRAALLAVGVATAIPGVSLMGTLAIPDVPLLLWTAVVLLALQRALQTDRLRWWLLGGIAGALGLVSEYRFAPFGLAVAAVLVATPWGRRAWSGPGPWLMAALSLLGLLPTLLFNLELDFAPLRYQLLDRHGGDGPGLLKHVQQQLVVMTPLLYVAAMATLGALIVRGRRGDRDAATFGLLALVPLGFWLALSPFSDDHHADAHWPLPGYLPLLPFLPGVLVALAARGRTGLAVAAATPALGAAALVSVLLAALLPATSTSLLRPFLGWTGLGEALSVRLAGWDGERPVVVLDNYVAASQAEFVLTGANPSLLTTSPWYVLDHKLNRNHGRSLQYRLWGRGERALAELAGRPALVVVEVDRTNERERPAWIEHVGRFVQPLEPMGQLRAGPGQRPRRFRFYQGRVAERSPPAGD